MMLIKCKTKITENYTKYHKNNESFKMQFISNLYNLHFVTFKRIPNGREAIESQHIKMHSLE